MSDQFVYFIQADESGPIKIGFTSGDPQARLAQLQTGNHSALKLLGAIKGNTAKERELHIELSEWRLQGEWFQSHPTVLDTIKRVLSANEVRNDPCLNCSFCGTCQHKTPALISGPNDVFICAACVTICVEVVAEKLMKKAAHLAADDQIADALANPPVDVGSCH